MRAGGQESRGDIGGGSARAVVPACDVLAVEYFVAAVVVVVVLVVAAVVAAVVAVVVVVVMVVVDVAVVASTAVFEQNSSALAADTAHANDDILAVASDGGGGTKGADVRLNVNAASPEVEIALQMVAYVAAESNNGVESAEFHESVRAAPLGSVLPPATGRMPPPVLPACQGAFHSPRILVLFPSFLPCPSPLHLCYRSRPSSCLFPTENEHIRPFLLEIAGQKVAREAGSPELHTNLRGVCPLTV